MSRTWTICTEGRLLDHYTTLPRRTLRGKIIRFLKSIFPWNSAGRRCFEAGGAVFIMNSKRYIWGKLDINFVVVDLPPSFATQVFFGPMRDIHRTTSPTSLPNWISQKHSHHGNMIRITFAVLIFRVIVKVVGNDDRNWIYSSPTEKMSDAILLVYPLHGALAKNACASHTRWNNLW